jgi:hypothetical protein
MEVAGACAEPEERVAARRTTVVTKRVMLTSSPPSRVDYRCATARRLAREGALGEYTAIG